MGALEPQVVGMHLDRKQRGFHQPQSEPSPCSAKHLLAKVSLLIPVCPQSPTLIIVIMTASWNLQILLSLCISIPFMLKTKEWGKEDRKGRERNEKKHLKTSNKGDRGRQNSLIMAPRP